MLVALSVKNKKHFSLGIFYSSNNELIIFLILTAVCELKIPQHLTRFLLESNYLISS